LGGFFPYSYNICIYYSKFQKKTIERGIEYDRYSDTIGIFDSFSAPHFLGHHFLIDFVRQYSALITLDIVLSSVVVYTFQFLRSYLTLLHASYIIHKLEFKKKPSPFLCELLHGYVFIVQEIIVLLNT